MTVPRGTAEGWLVMRREVPENVGESGAVQYLFVEGVFQYPRWVDHPLKSSPMSAARAMQWADALRRPPLDQLVYSSASGRTSAQKVAWPEEMQPRIVSIASFAEAPETQRDRRY